MGVCLSTAVLAVVGILLAKGALRVTVAVVCMDAIAVESLVLAAPVVGAIRFGCK